MSRDELAELLDRASANDRDAFESFFDLTYPQARQLARMVAAPIDIDELLHDSYVGAWTTSADFQTSGTTALAWLLAAVQHRASCIRHEHPAAT